MAKREQGYALTVKMFLPVNPKDLNDTTAKATAIQAAKDYGTLDKLATAGAVVIGVDHRYTSREKPETPATMPETVDTQSTGPGSGGATEEEPSRVSVNGTHHDRIGEEADDAVIEVQSEGDQQSEAIEEVATGRRSRRVA
jgi:hypothetical protein